MLVVSHTQVSKAFSEVVLRWYDRCARTLPWRLPPGSTIKPDPYRVWVSEIMLQQTTVQTVIPYFQNFMARWGDVHALAAACLDDVLHAWQGLGYYTRARALHKTAKMLSAQGGQFPQERKALERLPGIGPYTAGAIAAIAFDQPEVAIDGNITRVIARLCGLNVPYAELKSAIQQNAEALIPAKRCGDYTQALMDLGARVCTPKKPQCHICPAAGLCVAKARGQVGQLPPLKPRMPPKIRHTHFFWIERADGMLLLEQEQGRLLHNLWRPPSGPWTDTEHAPCFPTNTDWQELGQVRHVFTHIRLNATVWLGRAQRADRSDGLWIQPTDIGSKALSRLAQKALVLWQQAQPSK